jgi:hypothetical protein
MEESKEAEIQRLPIVDYLNIKATKKCLKLFSKLIENPDDESLKFIKLDSARNLKAFRRSKQQVINLFESIGYIKDGEIMNLKQFNQEHC